MSEKNISLDNLQKFKEKADEAYATPSDLSAKQDTLVSGENIKTINDTSLLGSGNIDINFLIETTWAALKGLRDNSQLIPGRFYRITDYTCTTTQAGTSSAGHVFDIIVRADAINVLNETAWAINHSGDTYFANSNLAAWQLNYRLDNDTSNFWWADATNGKGIIYRLIDEFNNDLPYDFKNILFSRNHFTIYNYSSPFCMYFRNSSLDTGEYFGWERADDGSDTYDRPLIIYTKTGIPTETTKLYRNTSGSTLSSSYTAHNYTNSDVNCYTFSYTQSGIKDGSLLNSVCNNIVGSYLSYSKYLLPANVWYSTSASLSTCGNEIEFSCHDNRFNSGFKFNIMKAGSCFNEISSSNASRNLFGCQFTNNIISGGFENNTFGNYNHNHNFSSNTSWNIFGSTCSYISIGYTSAWNTFGDNCSNITLGSQCNYNVFNSLSSYITLPNSSSNNIFDGNNSYLRVSNTNSKNIHVHAGVKGTSSSYKTITVTENLSYTTDVYPIGSTEMFI